MSPASPAQAMSRPRSAAILCVTVLSAASGVLAACSGSSTPAATTEAPPATSGTGVPALMAGPSSRYQSIEVTAGSRRAPVAGSLADGLVPLLIARDFGPQPSLTQYGLDHPSATLTFAATTATVTVFIGLANFDASGFYAMRSDRPNVYLVLAGPIRPVLALVGVHA